MVKNGGDCCERRGSGKLALRSFGLARYCYGVEALACSWVRWCALATRSVINAVSGESSSPLSRKIVEYCDMCRLSRGDGCCPHEVLQRHRRGLALGMYANRNAANVSGLDRAFVTEDDVSRENGDITGHAHVPGASESIIQLSERPSELDAICAMRAMLFLSDNLIGKVENGGTEPIPQTQHMQVLQVAHQRSSHRRHQGVFVV